MAFLVRYLLLGLLFLLIARSFWKFIGSIIEGASSPQGGPQKAPDRGVALVRDPVCGTFVVPSAALALTHRDQVIYFCSEACRRAFRPGRAAGSAARPS
jgi:YHS domain-containing protein